ncbi:MAG: hypothetical protein NTX25_04930 [Proteobacteria bacterium]|nr:hypothetical protein [Pseudomonadota bacterium]
MSEVEDASAYLVDFLARFTLLLEGQLLNIQETMVNTVETVMKEVTGISEITEDRGHHAEKVLDNLYINPDIETQILIQDVQKVVDDIFEETLQLELEGKQQTKGPVTEPELLVRNRIKRLTGKFGGEMGALTDLDEELRKTVFGIIGALSSEDVIAQKIDHVIMSLKILQTGLNYVLIDYNERCTTAVMAKVTVDIKTLTFRQYTAEDEKQRFHSVFPREESGLKAS